MAEQQQAPDLTNCISHTEFASKDPDATVKFFSDVFGYAFDNMPSPMGPYHGTRMNNGAGLAVRAVNEAGGEPVAATPYITVPDLEAAGNKIKENGGTAMMENHPVDGRGRFSWYQIPGGNFLAIWQDDPDAKGAQ